MMDDTDVIIVGAGPCGLLLAYLLVSNGIGVRVLEQHTSFDRAFRGDILQHSSASILSHLGLLQPLLATGAAVPLEAVSLHLGDRRMFQLKDRASDAFDGATLVVPQPVLLEALHRACSRYPHYHLELGSRVSGTLSTGDEVTGVSVGRGPAKSTRTARLVVVCAGRKSVLREQPGLEVTDLDAVYNDLWLRFDTRGIFEHTQRDIRVFFGKESSFVGYAPAPDTLQLAWMTALPVQALKDYGAVRERLLDASPAQYRRLLEERLTPETPRQILKIVCDRLDRWWAPGLLFLGDAAHTVSPMAAQGVSLAMRDAVVAANHLVVAFQEQRPWDTSLLAAIESERRPEIEAVQAMQLADARLAFHSSATNKRIAFAFASVFTRLGINRSGRRIQRGVTDVRLDPRCCPREVASHRSSTDRPATAMSEM